MQNDEITSHRIAFSPLVGVPPPTEFFSALARQL